MEQKSKHAPYPIRVSILTGGFHGWMNFFASSCNGIVSLKKPDYVVDFDPKHWSDCGPKAGGLVHVMDALWTEGGKQALSDALFDALGELSADAASRKSSTGSGVPKTDIVNEKAETHNEKAETYRLIQELDDTNNNQLINTIFTVQRNPNGDTADPGTQLIIFQYTSRRFDAN